MGKGALGISGVGRTSGKHSVAEQAAFTVRVCMLGALVVREFLEKELGIGRRTSDVGIGVLGVFRVGPILR